MLSLSMNCLHRLRESFLMSDSCLHPSFLISCAAAHDYLSRVPVSLKKDAAGFADHVGRPLELRRQVCPNAPLSIRIGARFVA
ncbi:hypothetical protein K469DRAFT_366356 [Zopfia rhizophila CBS 207.26]|uniref:Uncharacterized protein n=1 Tax=Zopfia rhizophila CBS 207.26 TaxID=1314779 RepID=A0A6A6EJK4_9PEZI|nr:hypothetical protein K469DRAFT_366356 [Zopfia rhizophila CBS 207.26]